MERHNNETLSRILSVATELFSNQEYSGVSLRQLTKKAGVNLAAVNYYFGDKKSLYHAVVARHIHPINQARLNKLHEAEQVAGDKPVPLAVILDILFRPFFELNQDKINGGHHIGLIVGRSMVAPHIITNQTLVRELQPITPAFAHALRRQVLNLPTDDFMWRLSFVVGALHHTLATLHRMKELTQGICPDNDCEGALRRLIQFSTVTLTAPALNISDPQSPVPREFVDAD